MIISWSTPQPCIGSLRECHPARLPYFSCRKRLPWVMCPSPSTDCSKLVNFFHYLFIFFWSEKARQDWTQVWVQDLDLTSHRKYDLGLDSLVRTLVLLHWCSELCAIWNWTDGNLFKFEFEVCKQNVRKQYLTDLAEKLLLKDNLKSLSCKAWNRHCKK